MSAPIAKHYACHSRPRPTAETTTRMQAGWKPTLLGSREAVMVDVPHVMSTGCMYEANKPDPRCADCPWMRGN